MWLELREALEVADTEPVTEAVAVALPDAVEVRLTVCVRVLVEEAVGERVGVKVVVSAPQGLTLTEPEGRLGTPTPAATTAQSMKQRSPLQTPTP